MALEFTFFADRLPSSAERMEILTAGRLFEKFGEIRSFLFDKSIFLKTGEIIFYR